MSLPVLVRIASCLHVSLDYLILGTHPQASAVIRESADKPYAASEVLELLDRCTPEELTLMAKIVRILLPYLRRDK